MSSAIREIREIRQDVVHDIVKVMTSTSHPVWHPCDDGDGKDRGAELDLRYNLLGGWLCGFGSRYWKGFAGEYGFTAFTEAEMRAAWRSMRDDGYHVFRVLDYGVWPGYQALRDAVCRDYADAVEVDDFTERWE